MTRISATATVNVTRFTKDRPSLLPSLPRTGILSLFISHFFSCVIFFFFFLTHLPFSRLPVAYRLGVDFSSFLLGANRWLFPLFPVYWLFLPCHKKRKKKKELLLFIFFFSWEGRIDVVRPTCSFQRVSSVHRSGCCSLLIESIEKELFRVWLSGTGRVSWPESQQPLIACNLISTAKS